MDDFSYLNYQHISRRDHLRNIYDELAAIKEIILRVYVKMQCIAGRSHGSSHSQPCHLSLEDSNDPSVAKVMFVETTFATRRVSLLVRRSYVIH